MQVSSQHRPKDLEKCYATTGFTAAAAVLGIPGHSEQMKITTTYL